MPAATRSAPRASPPTLWTPTGLGGAGRLAHQPARRRPGPVRIVGGGARPDRRVAQGRARGGGARRRRPTFTDRPPRSNVASGSCPTHTAPSSVVGGEISRCARTSACVCTRARRCRARPPEPRSARRGLRRGGRPAADRASSQSAGRDRRGTRVTAAIRSGNAGSGCIASRSQVSRSTGRQCSVRCVRWLALMNQP